MNEVGTLLHVSGHCHWAYGVYHSHKKKIPCVIASVCTSNWVNPIQLFFTAPTKRGDKRGDLLRGGYNVHNLPIVCDIVIPEGPLDPSDKWIFKSSLIVEDQKMEIIKEKDTSSLSVSQNLPKMLMFGREEYSELVNRLKGYSKNYEVDYSSNDEEFLEKFLEKEQKKNYIVWIYICDKMDNLKSMVDAVRGVYGKKIYIICYALFRFQTKPEISVDMFANEKTESSLIERLNYLSENNHDESGEMGE